jgi:N-acetyl-gamma-glutamylphosphate reductase
VTKVAILGSSGYLGSFLVQSLKQKFQIISHSTNKIEDKKYKKKNL